MIRIEHLSKVYPNAHPLRDVHVTINNGDIISIIGPSGTGKSTLLRCINQLEKVTSGHIYIDDEEITSNKVKLNIIRQKMGMVFQSYNLFDHMMVVENIMYAPVKLKGLSKQEAFDKAMSLLDLVHLKDKAFNYPNELSGGQKQRVAIARALAMEPEIIFFDEATSALDPAMVKEVQQVIKSLVNENIIMLLVTHQMGFAKEISNRVFYMDQGIIYEDGTPQQIFENPQKERTKAFIQHLTVLSKDITAASFDSYTFNQELVTFLNRFDASHQTFNYINLIEDEIGTNVLLQHHYKKVTMLIEYSEINQSFDVIYIYDGKSLNPMDQLDAISKDLVIHASLSYEYSYNEERNKLVFHIR